jgi:hypothetical protein
MAIGREVVFNNARDHPLRYAERFGELLRGVRAAGG